jgi:predicted ABC-type ATPase
MTQENFKAILKDFVAYDYKESLGALTEMFKSQPKKVKYMYVVAGPNGSGKSTLIANLYKKHAMAEHYINADLVARDLEQRIPNERERNMIAMRYTTHAVQRHIEEGESFVYETVLSHPSKLDIVREAKEKGYTVVSYFVCTKSPKINVERVAMRVEQGGHDVPKDKIISRYHRSVENGKELKALSDEFYAFDNSLDLNAKMQEELSRE